jgi:chorismate mutase
MRHYDAAQRSSKITGRKNSERLELPNPVRNPRREKQVTDRVREENEDDEVVEFEDASQRG